ncbi:MAG: M48 family metallopeptidase [Bacteroidota bacterium]
MNSEKFEEIEGIGRIRYVRNRKARNISIRISREGEVRVTVPGNLSLRFAEKFVEQKISWIKATRSRVVARNGERTKLLPGTVIQAGAFRIGIVLAETVKNGCKVKRDKQDFFLLVSPAKDFSLPEVQEEIRAELWKIITKAGKEVLPDRVKELAERHGLAYTQVRVRKMKSRWGSCSAANVINLSSTLMLLPAHLCDYVILHELAHTIHRNHGEKFWKLLDSLAGDSLVLRRELRRVKSDY